MSTEETNSSGHVRLRDAPLPYSPGSILDGGREWESLFPVLPPSFGGPRPSVARSDPGRTNPQGGSSDSSPEVTLHPSIAEAQSLFHAACNGEIRSLSDTRPGSFSPLTVGSFPPVPDLSKVSWQVIPSLVRRPDQYLDPSTPIAVRSDSLGVLEALATSSIRASSILLSSSDELSCQLSSDTSHLDMELVLLLREALKDLSYSLVEQAGTWETFMRLQALNSSSLSESSRSRLLALPLGNSFGHALREAVVKGELARVPSLDLDLDESLVRSWVSDSAEEDTSSSSGSGGEQEFGYPSPDSLLEEEDFRVAPISPVSGPVWGHPHGSSSDPSPLAEPSGPPRENLGYQDLEQFQEALPPPSPPESQPRAIVPDSADSLAPKLPQWEALGTAPWLLSIVKDGFRLPWKDSPPPLSSVPVIFPPPHDVSAFKTLSEEVESLCIKGAVEEVTHSLPGFYGRLFCVPKASGGWRPVLDLSPLNKFLTERPFIMESTDSIRKALKEGDWGTSLDLSDAYFHVRIHRRYRRYLRFSWQGKVYQFKVLPFGLSLAPWVFTKLVQAIASSLHVLGIRMHVYLDDWLILALSRQACARDTYRVLQRAQQLGFRVNHEKSDFEPSQSFVFLGVQFCTISMTVSPSQSRVVKLQNSLLECGKIGSFVTARGLHSLLGQMESMSSLVPGGRIHKRSLQSEVRARWAQVSQHWNTRIRIGPWFMEAASQWLKSDWALSGVPMTLPDPSVTLYTDASLQGWGGHIGDQVVSGEWDSESTFHINALEMEAVRRCLLHFQPLVQNRSVRLLSDNLTVVHYLNKQGGTRSSTLCQRAVDILKWCHAQGITLIASHLAGSLNVVADQLSRSDQILPSEWSISQGILSQVWSFFGDTPHIDMFATCFNFKLPTYVSPVKDDAALFQDAFSRDWNGLFFYAFPPFTIIGKVLFKVQRDRPKCILILPWWPSKFWWPYLVALSSAEPLPLDISSRWALVQPRSGVPHGNKDSLRLHAWFIRN